MEEVGVGVQEVGSCGCVGSRRRRRRRRFWWGGGGGGGGGGERGRKAVVMVKTVVVVERAEDGWSFVGREWVRGCEFWDCKRRG